MRRLLRSDDDASVFTSVSEWAGAASLQAWKESAGVPGGTRVRRALCDDFVGGDLWVATAIG